MADGARLLRLSGTELVPSWRGRLHLGAALLSVPAAAAGIAHDPAIPVAGYAAGLVTLFSVSAAYHVAPMSGAARQWWRRADHAVIYLFMALASVPFYDWEVGGTLGVVLLCVSLAIGACGVATTMVRFRGSAPVGGALYMVMGWLAIIALPSAVPNLPASQLVLLALTGAFYSLGALFFALRWPDPAPKVFGYHEVWHASVIAASVCYFSFVWGLHR